MLEALLVFTGVWLMACAIFMVPRYLCRRRARRACCGDMDHREDG